MLVCWRVFQASHPPGAFHGGSGWTYRCSDFSDQIIKGGEEDMSSGEIIATKNNCFHPWWFGKGILEIPWNPWKFEGNLGWWNRCDELGWRRLFFGCTLPGCETLSAPGHCRIGVRHIPSFCVARSIHQGTRECVQVWFTVSLIRIPQVQVYLWVARTEGLSVQANVMYIWFIKGPENVFRYGSRFL